MLESPTGSLVVVSVLVFLQICLVFLMMSLNICAAGFLFIPVVLSAVIYRKYRCLGDSRMPRSSKNLKISDELIISSHEAITSVMATTNSPGVIMRRIWSIDDVEH